MDRLLETTNNGTLQTGIGKPNLLEVLASIYYMGCFLLTNVSWGKVVMLALLCMMILVYLQSENGVFHIEIQWFHVFLLLFLIISLLSAIWAKNASDTISRCKSLLEILVSTMILYLVFDCGNQVERLLRAMMWAGVIGALILTIYYGRGNLLVLLQSGDRLNGQLWNVNTLARMMTTSVLLMFYFTLYHGWRWKYLLVLPSVLIMITAQSRTAIAALVGGMTALILLRLLSGQKKSRRKNVFSILLIIAVVYVAFRSGLADGNLERIDGVVSIFSGRGKVDSSAHKRLELIRAGLQQFLITPLFGIGLNNAHYLAISAVGSDYYLHNNYVELLAGVGLVGTVCFYAVYMRLAAGFLRFRSRKDVCLPACAALLTTQLLMEMGSVSYYKKDVYFVLVVCILELKQLQQMENVK